MHNHALQRTLISASVAAACSLMGLPAWAQTSDATPVAAGADAPVQVVEVTGFRSSLEKSLNLKRSAIATRESIVAEDIGKFPEQNIADALIRLPGVEVSRDGNSGEGQRVQLRGLGPEYTVTTFNGAPVRTTSAGNIGGATRDFNYDVFASELFGRADVYKTPLAELEEGGVAGVVDLQTPRPFDKKGRVIRGSVAVANNSRSGANSPRAHLLFSQTIGNWGFLASVAQNKSHNGNAGFQSTGVYNSANQRLLGGAANYQWNFADPRANLGGLTQAQINDAIMPRFLRLVENDTQRERFGYNTSLQYKTPDLDLSWDTLGSNLKDDSKSNYLNFPIRDALLSSGRGLVPINVTIDPNNNLQGTVANVTMGTNAVLGLSETDFKYNALNARYRVSENLRLTGQFTTSTSVAWRSNATMTADALDPAVRHTITFNTVSDPLFPDVSTDRNLLDPHNYTSFGYSGSYASETDKQKTGKLVADYDYGFGAVQAKLKVGLSQVQSTKLARSYTPANLLNDQVIPGVGSYGTATAAQKAAYGQSVLVANDLTNIKSGGNVPTSWLTFNRDFVYGTLDAYNKNRVAPANLGGTFDAVETIRTLFVQSDFTTDLSGHELRVNAGVRYVKTDTDIDNFLLVKGAYRPVQRDGSYSNVLPSLTAAYDIMPELTWRASWGKTIKRSSISAIARAFNVPNGGNLVVDAGNPDLAPESSKNLDTSLEWYFTKDSYVAANLFQKQIKDRPVSVSTFVPFDSLGLPKELFTTNVQAALETTPGSPVEVRSFRNAEAFKIRGLELAYQQSFRFLPAPFDKTGAIVSLTKIDVAGVSRVYNGVSYELPIVPENTQTATVYYEDGPWSLRTSYNHRSEYANYSQSSTNPLGYQSWFNARGFWDASVGYKINSYLELRLDGQNLTNTRTYVFFRQFEGKNGNEQTRVDQATVGGRTVSLALRGKF